MNFMKIFLTIATLLISLLSFCQSKWHPYAGIHASMDAGGYYVGPSLQLGSDYLFNKQLVFTFYIHYFPKQINAKYSDGTFEKGKYRSAIAALLVQRNFYKMENKGLFLAGGMAIQRTSDDYISTFDEEHLKRTIAVLAMRLGYAFPFKKKPFTIEFNATGPHIGKKGPAPYYEQTIEILTQLSLGLRIIL